MSEYTPGPWRTAKPDADGWFWPSVHTEDGQTIAEVVGFGGAPDGMPTRQSNARLIAAAPEWMALATEYRNTHNQRGSDGPCDCAHCREFDRLMEKTNADS